MAVGFYKAHYRTSPAGKRAILLALVGDVYCILLLSHVVSWVRCGT